MVKEMPVIEMIVDIIMLVGRLPLIRHLILYVQSVVIIKYAVDMERVQIIPRGHVHVILATVSENAC